MYCVAERPVAGEAEIGVGKTHLASSLVIAVARSGRRAYYYSTLADVIGSLKETQTAGRLAQQLKLLTHPWPLVADETG